MAVTMILSDDDLEGPSLFLGCWLQRWAQLLCCSGDAQQMQRVCAALLQLLLAASC
jgi:hypothetical protein